MTEIKKPSLVGFKPTDEDYQMILDLIDKYNEKSPFPDFKMSNSDVLKLALRDFHARSFQK